MKRDELRRQLTQLLLAAPDADAVLKRHLEKKAGQTLSVPVKRESIASMSSPSERKSIFEADRERLGASLGSVTPDELARGLVPYSDRFRVFEDCNANLWIFIQTGPGNTFDLHSLKSLEGVFFEIAKSADFSRTKIIYLSHTEKDFSLGGHRRSFIDHIERGETDAIVDIGRSYRSALKIFSNIPCLLVGVAYGNAQGGGMELLMAMDLQFVWPGVKLGFPEVRSGLIAGMGGLSFVAHVVGPARAMRLNVEGRLIFSETAHEYGLVSHLSERPFDDALALANSGVDMSAAVAARLAIAPPKYDLLGRDIDAWVRHVCDGGFLSRKRNIDNDFAVIQKKLQ